MAVHDAERAAKAITVHLRDHDARNSPDVLCNLDREVWAVPVEHGAVRDFAQKCQIKPRRINQARAARDDDFKFLVGTDDVERFKESMAERPVPAIAFLWAVKRNPRHTGACEPV